jgi:hypothetical protein
MKTFRCHACRGVTLRAVLHAAERHSTLSCTPRSDTSHCHACSGVTLHTIMHAAERHSTLTCMPQSDTVMHPGSDTPRCHTSHGVKSPWCHVSSGSHLGGILSKYERWHDPVQGFTIREWKEKKAFFPDVMEAMNRWLSFFVLRVEHAFCSDVTVAMTRWLSFFCMESGECILLRY